MEGWAVYGPAALAELLDRPASNGQREGMVLRVGVGDTTAVSCDPGVYDLERAGDEGPLPAGAKVHQLQRPTPESLAHEQNRLAVLCDRGGPLGQIAGSEPLDFTSRCPELGV